MALETDRKFLLANDAWKREVIRSEHVRDGLIARFGEGKVRVRLTESSAWLTTKGARTGSSRLESSMKSLVPMPRKCCERSVRETLFLRKFGTLCHLAT
jgi:CYTH domain-containing protein